MFKGLPYLAIEVETNEGTQGVFGFCAGCVMFSFAVKLGIVSQRVFDICEDSYEEMSAGLDQERSWPIGSTIFDYLLKVSTFIPKQGREKREECNFSSRAELSLSLILPL